MSVVIGEAVGPHASVGLPPSSMLRLPACTPFQEEAACNIRESVNIHAQPPTRHAAPFLDVLLFPVPPGCPSRPDPSPVPGFGRNREFNNKLPTLDNLLKVGGKAYKVRRSNL